MIPNFIIQTKQKKNKLNFIGNRTDPNKFTEPSRKQKYAGLEVWQVLESSVRAEKNSVVELNY